MVDTSFQEIEIDTYNNVLNMSFDFQQSFENKIDINIELDTELNS